MTPPRPHTTAYLRVSTNDQDVEKNKADILLLANRKTLATSTSSQKPFQVACPGVAGRLRRCLRTLQARRYPYRE